MHPIMGYQAKKAQIADLHRQAERDRTARAALAARKDSNTLQAPGHRAAALARRVLTVLGGRRLRPSPAPPRPSAKSHAVTASQPHPPATPPSPAPPWGQTGPATPARSVP